MLLIDSSILQNLISSFEAVFLIFQEHPFVYLELTPDFVLSVHRVPQITVFVVELVPNYEVIEAIPEHIVPHRILQHFLFDDGGDPVHYDCQCLLVIIRFFIFLQFIQPGRP